MNRTQQSFIYLTLASTLILESTHAVAQIGNTLFGQDALKNVTTGDYNSAFGFNSLLFTTAGVVNTGSGAYSLYSNTTGSNNTANGTYSLYFNTTGNYNTAAGYSALNSNTTGARNTAFGANSLFFNTTGVDNTASGTYALHNNSIGINNTASGAYALYNNTIGESNTASGTFSLYRNTTGTDNTASGLSALEFNTTGKQNTALGMTSMYSNTAGKWNNAVGGKSLRSITTGNGNSAQGFASLYSTTSGSNNMAIGNTAGYMNQTGSGNVFLGWNAGYFETGSNTLYITNNQQTPLLYGQFHADPQFNKLGIGTKTIAAGDTIAVWNGARLTKGGVWTNASSRTLKDNIQTLSAEDANAALDALSPVRYVYKNSREEEYVGFIAEDVPELVATNDHKSLSPMDIVAVLTTVAKDQKTKVAREMAAKDAEIAALRDDLAQQEERMQQMELTLAEVLRKQSPSIQVGSAN